MSTKSNSAVTFVSAISKFSNQDVANRKFNITAEVELDSEGKAKEVRNGSMTSVNNPTSGNANFSKGRNGSYFNFSSNGFSDEETREAINDAFSFMESVSEHLKGTEE